MDDVENIVEQFETGELVLIAEALGLAPTSRWGSRKLVDVVRARLRRDGIPKTTNELVLDFLYVDGWIDKDGNPTSEDAGEQYPETVEEYLEQHELKEPDCYGFADSADPMCKKCPISPYCAEERIQSLPPCFGQLYSPNEEECLACIEAPFCREGVKENE